MTAELQKLHVLDRERPLTPLSGVGPGYGKGIATLVEQATSAGSMTMSGDAHRTDWISPSSQEDAHVDVRLRSHGDDAWRRDHIECTDWSAELHGLPGNIDSVAHKALMLARL